ncbi:mitochondrial 37S ribosomal protein bS21m [Aspergillus melleus]|uniref:mitochondrial 37S ribosomal protein bS21m n=1 Tax=Aspergillus melleus TaxID=138277 RepID=UPI001E8D49DD|nr:uncharacterized protein LDX57_009827 [Aspergillus melleus]KAH8432188.1 hypothetical protein LDX57_009827 [Aspergillus melleus]
MEMRSLTRSLLRARPTSLYTTTAPSSILYGQFLANQRFASSSSTTTPFHGPRSQNKPSPSDSGASDFDQILDKLNINNAAPKSQNPYASTTSGATQQRTGSDGSSNNDGALAVSRALNAATSPVVPLRKVALKLGPSLGRQVHVEPERGMDLASSLRVLQSTCNQNKVKQDTYTQKFHVRRGQVRKDLRVQRWRKLFKYSFQRTVARIDRMRAQGW